MSHIFVEELESIPVFILGINLSLSLLRISLNPSTEQHSLQPAASSHHGCRWVFGERAHLCSCAPSTVVVSRLTLGPLSAVLPPPPHRLAVEMQAQSSSQAWLCWNQPLWFNHEQTWDLSLWREPETYLVQCPSPSYLLSSWNLHYFVRRALYQLTLLTAIKFSFPTPHPSDSTQSFHFLAITLVQLSPEWS